MMMWQVVSGGPHGNNVRQDKETIVIVNRVILNKRCHKKICSSPTARLSLVENGRNVLEVDQVWGSGGKMLFTVQVCTNWFSQIKLFWAGIKTIY
jgi:hypothetical protein